MSKVRLEIYCQIYDFNSDPLTASEVFQMRKLKTNQSGRFTELQEMGVIESAGKRKCRLTGIEVLTWKTTPSLPKPLSKPPKKTTIETVRKRIISLGKKLKDPEKSELREIYHLLD